MTEREGVLSYEEFLYIARYTVRKIRSYPASCQKDMSYFHVLFPNEIRDYLFRREINSRSGFNFERRPAHV